LAVPLSSPRLAWTAKITVEQPSDPAWVGAHQRARCRPIAGWIPGGDSATPRSIHACQLLFEFNWRGVEHSMFDMEFHPIHSFLHHTMALHQPH
jgi:hypothetical protein